MRHDALNRSRDHVGASPLQISTGLTGAFFYRIDERPRYAFVCLCPKSGSTMWVRAFTRGLIAQGLKMADSPGQWHNLADR